MHNLGTVIAFEIRRTLTKPTFWLTSLAVPVLMLFIGGLMWFSQASADARAESARSEKVAFTYADASGVVSEAVAARLGGSRAPDAAQAAQAVREGRADLFVQVPADPTAQPVEVIGRDVGLFESGRWQAIARDLVQQSAEERIGDPHLTQLIRGVDTSAQLWVDGHPSAGPLGMIAPGLFIVLLYMTVLMLGNQMLTITVEEKENRVTEMILTTLDASVLIVGKIIAVIAVGLVQGLVFLLPALAATLIPGSAVSTQGGTLAIAGQPIVVDAGQMAIAAGLFIGGFLLFTSLLVTIGSIMPTAKDAGGAFGAVVVALFIPLYAFPMVMAGPNDPISQFLTWFPLTAPITALVRNATGTLPLPTALGVMAVLYATAAVLMVVGVRLFRQGSLSYDKRLQIGRFFRSRAR